MKEYKEGSIVVMKKQHPCGENRWEVIRTGIDIKLRCTKCDRIVMINRVDFEKRLKKVVE
ncbi:MAG: DUF951 domain-containing protein [Tenericutes bacterium]|jgi:hypothetical protein|nr:DUF951 domain-containing protein [Bacilli bacterium]MDD3995893.1 DUF951 domain-containing protein [Bacilli bacterium]MDD4623972.1 DUF951 domain-containing protein [Bacilli bacterium]MDD4831347.1 DUF951 domain-containing protein [Bacilli bacterium]NLV90618.1 DUF951 domain-containing protein [Mycoplasmatota bacterium]